MISFSRRWISFIVLATIVVYSTYSFFDASSFFGTSSIWDQPTLPENLGPPPPSLPEGFQWKDVPTHYPVSEMIPLPTSEPQTIPKIQSAPTPESALQKLERKERLAAVKKTFLRSWSAYKRYAWRQDEVAPLSGQYKNGFGGWGATLVDTLDTLWIMDLDHEFDIAVSALKELNFTSSTFYKVNLFETTIRYLGGLLSAYDLSGDRYPTLLEKAIELGDMLYVAFDTPNRMPIAHWDWMSAAKGARQKTPDSVALAEIGSLTLEFTRLTQLTGDPKYYDAVQRIMDVFEAQQMQTGIPGMWPISLSTKDLDFTRDRTFTWGAMADSMYEYLPKEYLMLGGRSTAYQTMYERSLKAAKENLFYRVMNPENQPIQFAGTARSMSHAAKLKYEAQHLACFAGGTLALASQAFNSSEDLITARELTDGCIWAYESMPSGIMPESFLAAPCQDEECAWNEDKWYEAIRQSNRQHDWQLSLQEHAQNVISEKGLAPGFADITDARYILRPEAIESVFILYRVTGDRRLQDKAWNMFRAIEKHTRTDIAYAAIHDVTLKHPEEEQHDDSMESFFTAETLKYFYLIFSEPDVVSLDEFVLNTEAHPLRRPVS